MNTRTHSSAHATAVQWVLWLALLGGVALCYWPGLSGTFVFDDDVNILENTALRVQSLNWLELWAAALSGHAGPLGRPVSLLTFALNYHFSGFDPFAFKLTNLLIHLGNTLLVGALAQVLCNASRETRLAFAVRPTWVDQSAGWMVAALWALHPLNLTGVLYVVQRMTSLSALFGLAALLIYVSYRTRTAHRNDIRHPFLAGLVAAALVLFCLALSALSKESGLLFAPLLFWIEIWFFGFRWNGQPARIFGLDVRRATLVLLSMAAIYVVAVKLPQMLSPAAFANRNFTLTERGMTQARVLMFYLRMLVLPSNGELSLYHDDVEISHGLWQPPSTAFAMAALVAITAASYALRKRFPELMFGWGWFLIAHALESTVFPLELVYEHRNYFATIGLMMVVPLMLRRVEREQTQRVFVAIFAGYLGLLGFVTYVRALQWSNPVDWIALEAANHPRSPRANYDLARVYMVLMNQSGDDRFGALADQALVRTTQAYLPGVLPFVARMQLAYFRKLQPDPALSGQVLDALKHWPYQNSTTPTLNSVVLCQIQRTCHMSDELVLQMLAAPLENPTLRLNDRAELLKLQAQYRINQEKDMAAGEALILESIRVKDDPSTRIMYAQSLGLQEKYNEGLAQLDKAQSMDRLGAYRRQIDLEREAMRRAQSE
ncbi:hypothetical protein [Variovorax sp.]|uniref:hypothetical protein n=1 Tax=Variovorax sp. TaxID=1871043 RepID=UPI002D46741D|nr:hypothetical protein [Variovorax sp.]HYP82880.1 hypothetical protein [Variovorax sp.]